MFIRGIEGFPGFLYICMLADVNRVVLTFWLHEDTNLAVQDMHLFYLADIDRNSLTLDAEESRHCVKVLRLGTGDFVHLTDGMGNLRQGTVLDANPRACIIQPGQLLETQMPRKPRLHMAVAPTKNIDRFEWFLETATDCGIDEITPVICEHSERRVVKAARMEKILVSAMKQSLRLWLPTLNPAIPLKEFIAKGLSGRRMIAWCGNTEKSGLANAIMAGEDAVILVGPEGDFSGDEFLNASEEGYRAVSLGNHRLRTETAALAGCIMFNQINEFL